MKKTIMIVDDNYDMIHCVKRGLDDISSSYSFMEADSGEECISLLKNRQIPDLILLDIMMPGIDGLETAAQIQSKPKWKKIPIVFLTARTDDVSRELGSAVSRDYIEKPFDIFDLKKRIDKIVGYQKSGKDRLSDCRKFT
ncbi:MAG: response regulator [Candidatus Aenigmarchaeota archaeon]|nr:response regulator [Candidatus Aenigmarchaeota archaeon]